MNKLHPGERYPSVKALVEAFGPEKGPIIRKIMEGPKFVPAYVDKLEMKRGPSRLERIDEVLGNCGVENIPAGHNDRSPSIWYSNTGDTYGTTVLKVRGQFRIGCWGDIVERGDYD